MKKILLFIFMLCGVANAFAAIGMGVNYTNSTGQPMIVTYREVTERKYSWQTSWPANPESDVTGTATVAPGDTLLLENELEFVDETPSFTRRVTYTFISAVPANTAPSLAFDGAAASGPTVTGNGWAADPEDGSPITRVEVYLDGVRKTDATLGGSRPDVASALGKPSYTNSGWSFSLSGVSVGTHTVRVVAVDSAGATAEASKAVTVTETWTEQYTFLNEWWHSSTLPNTSATDLGNGDSTWTPAWNPADHYPNESQAQTRQYGHKYYVYETSDFGGNRFKYYWYPFISTESRTLTGTKLIATTFSVSPTSFTYNGSAQGPTITPTPAGATWSVTAGQLTATNAGSYSVTATANGSYTGSSGAVAWTIAKANQTVSFTNPGTKTYGVTPFALVASAPGGAVTFSVVSGPASVSGSTCTITGAGSVTLRASQAGSGNYNAASADVTFTVNKAPQTALSVSASPTTVAFGNTSALSTSGGSGTGAVSYSSAAGGSISGSTFTAVGSTGTVVVTATKAGDANYNAQTGTVTLTLAKRAITITAPSGSKTYDGLTVSLGNPTVTSGSLRSGDSISFSGNTTSVAAAAGTTTVNTGTAIIRDGSSVDVTAHYAITYVNGSYTVNPAAATFTVAPTSFTYSGAAQGPTITPNPAGATFTTSGTASATNAGSYSVTATANGNYTGTSGAVAWSIGTRAITVTAASPSKTYDGSNLAVSAPTVTAGSLVAGHTISFSGNTTSVGPNAGSYPGSVGSVTIRNASSADVTANYAITTVAGSATISKAPQTALSAGNLTGVYGDTLTPTLTGGSGTGAVSWARTGGTATGYSVNSSTGATTVTSLGTVILTATKASDTNYNAASTTCTLTFNARPITITRAGSKTYNGTTASTGATASITSGSLAGTDTIAYAFAATSSANAGTYAITVTPTISNVSAPTSRTSLYAITYAGNYTINKAPQSALTATAGSAVYGNTITATTSGGSGTGAVTWALSTGHTASGPAVTSGGVISATSIGTVVVTATKAADTNYLAATASATATFTARPITVTLTGSKTYNGTTASTGASASITSGSLAAGDSIAYAFAATSSANAGTYSGLTTATVSNAAAPTTRTGSYAITYAGTYTINKAPQAALTVSASPATIAQGETSALSTSGGSGTGSVSYSSAAGGSITGSTFTATAASGSVVVTATKAGDTNYNAQTATVTITISIPVSGSVIFSESTATAPATVQAIWATSNATSVAVSGPGGFTSTGGTGTQSFANLGEGTYTVTVTAQGFRGPITRTASLTVNAANSAPSVVLNRIAGGGSIQPGYYTYSGDTIAVQAVVTDVDANLDRIEWSIDGGTPVVTALSGGAANPAVTAVLKEGVNTVTATVFDSAGAVRSETFQMTVVSPTTTVTIEAQAKAKANMSPWLQDSAKTTTIKTVNRMRGPIQ